jgi:hypothetical protein
MLDTVEYFSRSVEEWTCLCKVYTSQTRVARLRDCRVYTVPE